MGTERIGFVGNCLLYLSKYLVCIAKMNFGYIGHLVSIVGDSFTQSVTQATSKIDHRSAAIEKNELALRSALLNASSQRTRAVLVFLIVVEK